MKTDPKDESGCRKTIREAIKALNVFGVVMICLAVAYTTYCFCLSMPPVNYWLPKNWGSLRSLMQVTDGIWFVYSCISVFAFNTLKNGFCVLLCAQFKLLSYRLKNVIALQKGSEGEKLRKEIKNLVEYHVFLLE